MVPAPMLGQCGVRACVGHGAATWIGGQVGPSGCVLTQVPMPRLDGRTGRSTSRSAHAVAAGSVNDRRSNSVRSWPSPPKRSAPAISEGHVRALRDSTYSLLDATPATTAPTFSPGPRKDRPDHVVNRTDPAGHGAAPPPAGEHGPPEFQGGSAAGRRGGPARGRRYADAPERARTCRAGLSVPVSGRPIRQGRARPPRPRPACCQPGCRG